MGTRCLIALEDEYGQYESIYCHWDGYIEGVGQMLKENYMKLDKIKHLIELGDISSLREKIIPDGEHSFENPQSDVTVFYCRDRGEKDCNKKKSRDIMELVNTGEKCGAEYIYIFRKDHWEVIGYEFIDKSMEVYKKLLEGVISLFDKY